MKGIFFILIQIFSCCFASSAAITYTQSDGRFADRFLGYLHAKWISYSTGIPLLYKSFEFSDEFDFDDFEEKWTEEGEASFRQKVPYANETTLQESTLYEIPFFSDSPDDEYVSQKPLFKMDLNDRAFGSLLKAAFTPKKPRPKHPFPNIKDLLTVAVHVRRGGEFDPSHSFFIWPLRFAPDSYYIESLRLLCSYFPARPIYAYIFTDEEEPGLIADTYARALADLPIQFDCRREGNHFNSNIVEDFLLMMEFDCLIRSTSNYSLVPALVAGYQVVITPKSYTWIISPTGYSAENYITEKEIIRN